MSDNQQDLSKTLGILRDGNVMPSLSCGMHPGLIQAINKRFGIDYMANCGGSIHGHPHGTLSGTRAMWQSINNEPGQEYKEAINKWGLVE